MSKIIDKEIEESMLDATTGGSKNVDYKKSSNSTTPKDATPPSPRTPSKCAPRTPPKGETTGYISEQDIRPKFTYTYIKDLGQEFRDAMNYLDQQAVVGFDTEFITKDNT